MAAKSDDEQAGADSSQRLRIVLSLGRFRRSSARVGCCASVPQHLRRRRRAMRDADRVALTA